MKISEDFNNNIFKYINFHNIFSYNKFNDIFSSFNIFYTESFITIINNLEDERGNNYGKIKIYIWKGVIICLQIRVLII